MTRNRLDLLRVEDRGRLVHDDQPGVVGQRPRHADDLLAGGGQAADLGGGRDLGVAEAREEPGGRLAARSALGEAAAGHLVPEEDVLGDGQALDEVELLVDRRDAEVHGGLRVGEVDLLALPGDGALVGLVHAGEHLDEGRLAGAVLAREAVHLAGADVEVDPAERDHPGKRFTMSAMPKRVEASLPAMRRDASGLLSGRQAKVIITSNVVDLSTRSLLCFTTVT